MNHLLKVLSLSALGITLVLSPYNAIASEEKAIASRVDSASTSKEIRSQHWTYQSLKSLVDRYKCTAKDQPLANLMMQRKQTLTRFEIAATLRSCINKIGDRFINSQDRRITLALQREFKNEVTILEADKGNLIARSATLEAQQFSTEPRTRGEVVYGGTPDWAIQSLKELAVRYECTTGLNLPWKPEASDDRYELAWELNSCLDQSMIRFGSFKDKDQAIIDKLWAEFKPETSVIRARNEALEARVKELAQRELSPTTKVFAHFILPDVTSTQLNTVKSLVVKYRCISGTPQSFFQPDRPTTRYELAAGLNACLRRINNRFATQQDRDLARSLQQDFKAELADLNNRAKELETRAATLEVQNFSPTSKLQGQTVITIQGGGF
jgi:hypothetical protein